MMALSMSEVVLFVGVGCSESIRGDALPQAGTRYRHLRCHRQLLLLGLVLEDQLALEEEGAGGDDFALVRPA